MIMNRKLRIGIDCRIANSREGVGSAILALANALSMSDIADQEYTFIVRHEMEKWLAPYIYGPCTLVSLPGSNASRLKKYIRTITPVRLIWDKARGSMTPIPISDGYVESHGCDIVHFPAQPAYLTEIPSIYQPHDLQHLHYPNFFTKSEFALREKFYRAFCDRATFVCVQTTWTKQDIIKQYGISPEKVVVIPWGSSFSAYITPTAETAKATTEKYRLPSHFFFYPAVTWPHKNHEVIIRAIHSLKAHHGLTPDVYFTGRTTDFLSTLDRLANSLGVSKQLHYLGFLPPEELQVIFNTATAMVFPSKFEGFGLPVWEAFDAHLPVLASNATVLPEVAQDAALYFHPDSAQELANLMKMVMEQPKIRQNLITKGDQVLSRYSVKDMATKFQILYEQTAMSALGSKMLSDAKEAHK
jgi:glycosyltransferase involved in cell wall biosynthesis